ncbi:hypothetical protein [Nocardioides sp.]|uniref:hypothetical protein n=1 Tax=Nocardioides sp. TaxID=35761 RepID=UPI0035B3F6AB
MRVTSLARRLGSAALVLSVGVGLTACSGDSSGSDASSASDSDSEAGSATSDSSADAEETEEAALTELDAAGFYPAVMEAMREAETFTFQTVSESGGQSQTMEGEARFGDDGVEMKAASTGAQPMELIMVGQAMYLKSPDLGTGDKWLKIDLSDPNSLFGMIGKATDPEVMFKAMEAPKKIELLGTEEVDGVETNHYRVTMDPSQYLDAMEFPASMADMLPEELVTEMWVDGDNLPRKFSQSLDVPSVAGGKPTSTTSEGTYSDFGTDVDIEAPPADQVTEDMFPGAA